MYTEQQIAVYQHMAEEMKQDLKDTGHIDADIAAIAYFLLKGSIGGAEKLKSLEAGTADVMARAEALLRELEEGE